jgi:microcin C transport system substrate-binding protein
VRKAFAHLFDVEKLNKRLFFNEYSQLNTFFFGTPYANPRNPYTKYDPEKALSLLSEAGWNMEPGETWLSKNGEKFEFEFLIATGGERIYSAFQDDLSKVGVKMTFNQMDNIGKFSSTMKKEFEVTSQGWTAGFFPSPEGMMHSKFAEDIEVTNITSMAIPDLDKLIDMYNAEWDAKKRVPLAHKIDSIAINSYHYAMGWTSPYGLRMMYWNKFGIPEKGISYIGDWMAPIFMWWVDPDKEIELKNAITSQKNLPPSKAGKKSSDGDWNEIDYWNKKP